MRSETSLPTTEELQGRRSWEPFDPDCVAVLNHILQATAADIVITSDWKHTKNIAEIGDFYQSQGVIVRPRACTPSLPLNLSYHQQRAAEIESWLAMNPGTHAWTAVDDLCLPLPSLAWAKDAHAAITAPGLADQIIGLLNTRA
jgi:HAD domain in Swiss Army Knife RNA repair proteins